MIIYIGLEINIDIKLSHNLDFYRKESLTIKSQG